MSKVLLQNIDVVPQDASKCLVFGQVAASNEANPTK
jgi:hypothetical protein